jgi:DNA excision repair protein ERCC-6
LQAHHYLKLTTLLCRSRESCQSARISTPTWTGRHGTAGAPPPLPPPGPRRFGNVSRSNRPGSTAPPTAGSGSRPNAFSGRMAGTSGAGQLPRSTDLISSIRGRQADVAVAVEEDAARVSVRASSPSAGAGTSGVDERAVRMMSSIVEYFSSHGGEAASTAVVDHFRTQLEAEDLPVFRCGFYLYYIVCY